MTQKPYFPMFVNLSDKNVVVIGAGTIAKRRIRTLCAFTDHLRVVAPEVNPELLQMEAEGKITITRKHYEREDLLGADLVIAATNDRKINLDIHAACKCMGILVNVCSDRNRCDFYFPGVAVDGPLVAGVTSSGCDPKRSKKLVEAIRKLLVQFR